MISDEIIQKLVDIKCMARIGTPKRAARELGELLAKHDFDDVNINDDFINGAWCIADIMIDEIKKMKEGKE